MVLPFDREITPDCPYNPVSRLVGPLPDANELEHEREYNHFRNLAKESTQEDIIDYLKEKLK